MTLQINEHSSDKVVVCNIPNYIVDCISVGGSVTLTPHEVVTLKKSRQNDLSRAESRETDIIKNK